MTCVLFDFDGPIVDLFDTRSELSVTRSVVDVAKKFGINETHDAPSPLFLSVWGQKRSAIERARGDVAAFDREVHTEIERHEFDMLRASVVPSDSKKMLAAAYRLAHGVAIVSNNSANAIRSWLSEHRLVHLADFVSGREVEHAFESLKPSPDLINRALRHLRAKPDDTIFFGDTETDHLSSLVAGVRFVGVRTRHSMVGRASARDFPLDSRAAVSHYIQSVLAR